jgi:hypothetical protein
MAKEWESEPKIFIFRILANISIRADKMLMLRI